MSYLCYKDANNLYGWEVSNHLPCSDFKWLTDHEIVHFDIHLVKEDIDTIYILEK